MGQGTRPGSFLEICWQIVLFSYVSRLVLPWLRARSLQPPGGVGDPIRADELSRPHAHVRGSCSAARDRQRRSPFPAPPERSVARPGRARCVVHQVCSGAGLQACEAAYQNQALPASGEAWNSAGFNGKEVQCLCTGRSRAAPRNSRGCGAWFGRGPGEDGWGRVALKHSAYREKSERQV